MAVTACDPPPIGTGCQFPKAKASVSLNQNTAGGGDGSINIAALDGGTAWNNAGSEGPRINSYWPAVPGSPAGLGDFEVRSFTDSQSSKSGFVSTSGPTSGGTAPAPACGSSSWATKPHVWLNETKIHQRESIGRWNWNIATAAHELGHALGLNHNQNDACADVTIMEATGTHGYLDCNVYKPRAGDVRTVNSLYT